MNPEVIMHTLTMNGNKLLLTDLTREVGRYRDTIFRAKVLSLKSCKIPVLEKGVTY